MENFENNQNNIEAEELSTVFSDPSEHSDGDKIGKKKRFLRALSLILVVAIVIGGTFAIIKLIPEMTDENLHVNKTIEVINYYAYDIKELTLKNKNGTFNIYSEIIEATEDEIGDTIWYLKGYDRVFTDNGILESVVNAAVDMDAIREITTKTLKECGLEKPEITVEATPYKGDKFTVSIGNPSPDKIGVYVKTSLNDKIYLVGKMADEKLLDETLNVTDLDLASLEKQEPIKIDDKYKSYLSNGQLSIFDTITVSGKNFPEEIAFMINEDDELASYIPFKVIRPMKRTAYNADQIFYLFSQGFDVRGAYSYDIDESSIEKFGLNDPDYVVSIKLSDFTYSYKFKKQIDGDYAFIGNDSKNIKKVSAEDCGFLNYTTTDFYSPIVFITPIDGVSNLKIETEDKTYDFNITLKDGGDSINKYIVECDGKTYNSTYFSSYYAFLCAITNMDFEVIETDIKPSLKMTFTYNDKSIEPSVIEYTKISATKYQYSVDGVAMGRIGSTSYNKIFKNLERLLAGKQVIVN